jgi:hypothetical protein
LLLPFSRSSSHAVFFALALGGSDLELGECAASPGEAGASAFADAFRSASFRRRRSSFSSSVRWRFSFFSFFSFFLRSGVSPASTSDIAPGKTRERARTSACGRE